ncbi:DUF2723 domain-containing protein [Candidatus Sumerlaeota bacterium]|nr:DUF2723 domain-containing protein [Candidatus Sumerlaeota bacterium]
MPLCPRIKELFSVYSFILLIVILIGIYIASIPSGIYWKDAGEFCLAGRFLGIAHPPGSPLYVAIGRIFSFIPLRDVAFRMGCLSAVFGGLSIGLLFLTVYYAFNHLSLPLRGKFPVLLSVASIGIGASFWHYSAVPEVYTLGLFLFLLGFYFYQCWIISRRLNYLASGFLALGLACSVYLPLVIYVPIFIAVLIISVRLRNLPRLVLVSGVFFLLGLLIFLFLPFRAHGSPILNWGKPDTLPRLIAHITGSQYQGAKLIIPFVFFPYRLVRLAGMFIYEFPVVLLITGLLGFMTSTSLRKGWQIWLIPGYVVVTNIVFSLRYVEWLPHFFLPAYLMLGFLATIGTLHFTKRRTLIIILLLINFLWLAGSGLKIARARKSSFPEKMATTILDSLPGRALLVLENGNSVNICLYEQWCRGRRPDVIILDPFGTYYTQAQHKGFTALADYVLSWQDPRRPSFRTALLSHITDFLKERRVFADSIFVLNSHLQERYVLSPVTPGIWEIMGKGSVVSDDWIRKKIKALREFFTKSIEEDILLTASAYGQNLEALLAIVNNATEVYYQLGFKEEAIRLWEQAMSVSPPSPAVMTNLIRAYDEMGRSTEAIPLVKKLLTRYPDREDTHSTAGIFYLRHQDYPRAIKEFRTVLKFNPHNKQAERNLKALLKIPLE